LHYEIGKAADEQGIDLMVIGSHGFKGLREIILGVDILKLAKNICIPVICIQKDYNIPEEGFKTILLPASSHKLFHNNINAIVSLARWFQAEVHMYSINKPKIPWPDSLKSNIETAIKTFESERINFKRVNEQENILFPGFAKQILNYAKKINADLISVMSEPSFEYYYFADIDKERLLTNRLQIPILCVSDKWKV
jgi:hypothetical protein